MTRPRGKWPGTAAGSGSSAPMWAFGASRQRIFQKPFQGRGRSAASRRRRAGQPDGHGNGAGKRPTAAGAPVCRREMAIGVVSRAALSRDAGSVTAEIYIAPDYVPLPVNITVAREDSLLGWGRKIRRQGWILSSSPAGRTECRMIDAPAPAPTLGASAHQDPPRQMSTMS